MTTSSFLSPQTALLLSTTFLLVSFTQLAAQSQQLNTPRIRFVQPTLEKQPENRGAPRDRKGAGTRGDCPVANKPLTALVPLMSKTANQKQVTTGTANTQYVLSLTTSEHPTFWFYVPYVPKNINSVKFVLLDEKNNSVTKQPIPITLSNTPGVISVNLPTTEIPLKIGQYYHWYFLIDCNPQSRSDDIAVEGLVQRIAPKDELIRRQKTATPRQQVALYAQAGIWQDAVTTLGELRRAKPQDATLKADWKDLLESVGLEDIATEAIAPCCTP
ncbi:hypothetical protein DP113_34365 (plasmid) [Brasilonema octagenarum UFV-E1]|uniref:DUF928 domain-containing protein n=2 Tax=Brasilonema TaxID=383614 RepID=A0A856MMZ2_9CYAN|nr:MULTISPECIES: DUF928 domain-containing protein [Brasilonema]NMF65515.1 hypothetical protein [Brasilonema octagenarum UFV-OR1]QDL12805.1 hypothetical protein DP114_34260 [Brasilonema sennae CENA114]QDL19201.1 hypothetical protein DP113_34365 [Brasilonema octagenarum UFV-E1]